ncbi:neutral/alkaline non-lysosomal ceramidase N-terminal domain-containing protein [Rubripirellula reticaptiva]|uniref:Neutral/alkaline non-lysosomal ceramidase n=1 Tax=Rubripirellula reticaptiva TaxID=2528013 RepID=A0A5C6F5S2_9BACT|nr:neutral/alkaline non-lysosomal ceramidase N-terminal domain-containing protein [Rubripirellula reticaptiva]TWU55874.1 Neutral/alkaline non-lysosomal ceramidase [Rubripirellula reticaptiva]
MNDRTCIWLILISMAVFRVSVSAAELVPVGFARQDITPDRDVRLSGYGSRDNVMTGVRDKIFVRAMAMGKDDKLCVMLSIEGIVVTAEQTKRLLAGIDEHHSIDRSRLVVCSTHSHAAPQIYGGLTNLLQNPPTEPQVKDLKDYLDIVQLQSLKCVEAAIKNQQPCQLTVGSSRASFAAHRRVITDGVWSGFGVSEDGPTDRRVRVLVARDGNGKLRGAVYQYACHCTTLGPSFNEVTGDWAGLSAAELETNNDSAVFLPVIGCGADANPEPRDSYEAAVAHGHEMAAAVESVLAMDSLTSLPGTPTTRFGYAGLSAEQPSREELTAYLDDPKVTRQRWARNMLDLWNTKGRLPESYPSPVHTWTFGDSLAWVFLGGEVVVQYQMRLEDELDAFDDVWVAAYTDDVFAYVASQRMRSAGGYEVDYSMVYYNQPGRWQSGTENLLVNRVKEVLRSPKQNEGFQSPSDSLNCMRVPEGFKIDLVAAEPLVVDPINVAFAADGSVWVVEMGDYPQGSPTGGRVKRLEDTTGDGTLDAATLFLDGLDYPTSVYPWRDGAIVIAAPDVLFARDSDGDGKADEREVLLTGIGKANPQHRASGFEWGLDGMIYFGAGDDTENLHSLRADVTVNVKGCDVRWDPESGHLERLPGKTQFIRSRDRWGRWYGNTNSVPLFHYRIDDVDLLKRNATVSRKQLVLDPGVAPPVFPSSRTVDRFNDLFAKNRITSACSSIVLRGDGMGQAMVDAALVCEPVHNLVARFRLQSDQATVKGTRFEQDQSLDWATSTDTWFRPVRVIEAPDGSVWIVDMYRKVIEHPQWIPDSWQQSLDLRAGSTAGRIYRVSKVDHLAQIQMNLADPKDYARNIASTSAAVRDLTAQQIKLTSDDEALEPLRRVARQATDPAIRLQAFGCLCFKDWHTAEDWARILNDKEPLVVATVIQLARRKWETAGKPVVAFTRKYLSASTHHPAIDSALLLALANAPSADADAQLTRLVDRTWMRAWGMEAMSLASVERAPIVVNRLLTAINLADAQLDPTQWNQTQDGIAALWATCRESDQQMILERLFDSTQAQMTSAQLMIALVVSPQSFDSSGKQNQLIKQVVDRAREELRSGDQPISMQVRAAQLLGCSLIPIENQLADLKEMLRPDQPGALRRAGLAAAYRIESEQTAQLLIDAWKQLLPDERTTAGATLLQRRDWTRRFIESLVDEKIKINDLDASTLSGLRNYDDYGIMKKFGSLLSISTPSERKDLIDRYVAEMSSSPQGEIKIAQKLYRENCAICHEPPSDKSQPISASVQSLGPPLANLKKWNTLQWATAVLDPNANIESKFKQYRILTKSGQVMAGVVIDQAESDVRMGLADGRQVLIARDKIERIEDSGVSMMPEGFEAKLSPKQLNQIVDYLRNR